MVFPTVMAFDRRDNGLFEVFAQFPNPTARTGGGTQAQAGGGSVSVPFWLNSGTGRTPYEAIKDITLTTSRRLSLSHVDVVLISERLARQSIAPVFELFLRNYELRLISQIAVVEGDLRSLLESELPLEPTPGLGLLRMLENVRTERSEIPNGNMLDKIRILSFPGFDITIIRIKVLNAADRQALIDPGSTGGGIAKPVVEIGGSAAFDGDKMVGWLEDREVCGTNWLLGNVSRSQAVVELPQGKGLVSLELKQSGCQLKPLVSDGQVGIFAKIGLLARIQDVTNTSSEGARLDPEDPEVVRSLARQTAQHVREDIEQAISKARELGADVFGFGNLIYRREPKMWDEIVKGQWDEFFKTINVTLDIEVGIRRPGRSMSSITSR